MKHFIVLVDWALDGDEEVIVVGVTHTLEEAKELFNKQVVKEKEFAKNNYWPIVTDDDDLFEAYPKGYYTTEHTVLYIKEVK